MGIAQREKIIVLLCVGIKPAVITEQLGCSCSTMYLVKNKYQATGSIARSVNPNSAHKKRDHAFLDELKTRINKDPHWSMWKMAKAMDVNQGTIRVAVKDLGMKSYTPRVQHLWLMPARTKGCHWARSCCHGSRTAATGPPSTFFRQKAENRGPGKEPL